MQIKKVIGIVAILLLSALLLSGAVAADSNQAYLEDNDTFFPSSTSEDVLGDLSDSKIDLSDKTISVHLVNSNDEKTSTFTYDGTAVTPEVVIRNTETSEILREGNDYVVTYWNNNGPGTGHVGIIGCGSYTGQIELTFDIEEGINQNSLDEVDNDSLSDSNTEESLTSISDNRFLKYLVDSANFRSEIFDYTGENVSPGMIIQDQTNGQILVEGKDYTTVYRENIECGTGYATAIGCGSYTGIVEIPFIIEESSEESVVDNEEEIPVPPIVFMTASPNSNTEGVADHIDVASSVSMSPGSTKTLSAWVVDSTGEWLDYEPVEFSITSGNSVSLTRSGGSNSHYVTLSTTGNSGNTVIEVKSVNYPDIKATSTVTVSDISELRINFDWYDVSTSYDQGEQILKLTTESVPGKLNGNVTDQYGGEFYNKTLTWTVDNSNVIELISITDESNPTEHVLLKPKEVGTAVVTATLDEDSNVTKSIKIDISSPTSIEIKESIPSAVTDEIDSAVGSVYGMDNLGLRVLNTDFNVEIVDGEDNASITSSQYSESYYNYSYRVGKHVYINPVEGKSGTRISIKISTNDERFAVKEITVPVNINAVDNSKTKVSVWYTKYNTSYHTTTDVSAQTTSEATCSFSAYIQDQYGYQTNRDIKWEYSGCIPATGSEPTGHYVSFVPQSSGTDMIVTAKDNPDKSSASTTITYTVEETVLTSVYQYVSNVNLTLNSTGSANACGRDQYGMELPYDVTWTSSNDSILRVETYEGNHYKYASLIPVSKGTATVTASVTQPGSSGKTLSWSTEINVEESIVSSVVVNGSTLVPVSSSNSYSLYANIYDQYGNHISDDSLSVTWKILSGSDVIKCEPYIYNSRNCSIKGLKEGTATIQASCEGKNSIETIINVYTPTVNGVQLYVYNEYLKIGGSNNINVYSIDQYGHRIDSNGITVTSSNPDVASVEKNTDSGSWYITGNSEGTVTVEATYGEYKSDTVSVEVYTSVATSINIEIYNGKMVGVGDNKELYAYVIDQHGSGMSDNTTSFTWSIASGNDVISLTPSTSEYQKNYCIIKGLKEGSATVTATYGNITSNELEITVYSQIATSVEISDVNIAVDSSRQYYAYLIDQYGYEIDTSKSSITWNIASGNDVISLTPSTSETQKNYCTIKGLKEGTAEITATCDSITSSKGKITVYSPQPTKMYLGSENYSVGVDYNISAYAWVLDQKGNGISNPALTWSVVSGNDVVNISYSENNRNNCTITGLKEGTATIRVSCDGITESEDISVTVYQPVPDKLFIYRDSINVGLDSTKRIECYLRDTNDHQMKTGSYDCTWTITDDTGEAVIQSSGKYDDYFWCEIKGVSAGESSVQASISGVTPASCPITVYDRVPTSIQLNEVYISPNSSSSCYAYLVDQFGNTMDSDTISFTWSIKSGEDVISLTPSTSEYQKNYCVIKGLKEGSAKISASYGEGDSLLTSETDVTVYTPVPAELDVNTSSCSVGVGYEKELYANAWDQHGQWMQNPPFSWNIVSGDDVISITISSDYQRYCTITGLKEGTATIRLSCTGSTETKDITVSVYTPILNKVRIGSNLTYIVKDSSSGIYASLYDQNGNRMKTGSYDCTWTITDGTENAEIISNGKNTYNFWCNVNGISEGDAKIQVSCSGLSSDICSLMIYTPIPKELTLNNIPYKLIPIGETNHYYVDVKDQMGNYISEPGVSFEITEGTEHVEIVSTSDNSCNVKGISEGTATLKATCGDLSKTITTEIYTQVPTSITLNNIKSIPVGCINSCSAYIIDQYGNSIDDNTLEVDFEVIDENDCVEYTESGNQSYNISLLGKKEGTVTINATCGTLTPASTNVTVYAQSASSIEVVYIKYSSTSSSEASGSSYELPLTDDYDQKFSIYCYDSNGYLMDDSDISYIWNIIEGNDVIALTPLTENAAECSITCLSEGTAKITVSDDSGLSVEKTVTVYTPKINGFNIGGPSNVAIGGSGSNSTIYGDVYDQYWNQINNADIEFHVDEAGSSVIRLDPIAEETNAVKVVGLSSGSATVTATCGSFSSELSVSTYTPEITSLYTSLSRLSGIPVGSPVTISVGGRDQKGNYSTAFTENVELVSGPGNVSITKDVEKTEKSVGYYYYNLTGISEGDVTLRVTCGDLSEDFVIPVYTQALTSLQISSASFTSPAGSDASIKVYGVDQNEQIMDVDMVSCRWQIIEGDDVISISPRFPHNDIIDISLKKNGFAKIQATCGDVSSNICLVGCGNNLWGSWTPTVPEDEPAYVVATPTIYPAGGTYSTLPSTVSISSSVSNSKTYYAINDGYTEEYTGPITVTLPSGTESFTVHAAVKDEKGVYSKNVTAEYTLGTGPEEEKHTITIAKSAGGTVTSNVSKAKTGDLVTLTFTPDTGYYLAGWTISDGKGTEEAKSSTVNTFSMWDSDVVITATFEPEEYTVTIAESEGGSVTSDVSKAKTGDIVTLTFTPDTGYLKGNWSVVGDDGTTVSKSSSVSTFNMLGQNVTVYATFTQDTTPKPTSVKITNAAGSIYVGDMGTLYATTYDQFGKQYSKDKVTWSSSSSSILSINATDGSYVALDDGEVTVTAISTEDSSVSGTISIEVEIPRKPVISSSLSGPDIAEYGKMSDDFIVNSENTTYLNWNWGDGSDSRTTTKDSTHSVDYVAHTFVPTEAGDVTVKVVPSNSYYAAGEEKETVIKVVYPSPSNVKITEGPSSVVAGDSVSYTGFATGADSYIWSFNGTVLTDQNDSTVSFTVPTNAPSVSTLKLTAVKSSASPTSVEKTVYVAQPAAPLGEFGELTTSPENPAKGDAVVLSITPVENASTYTWVINGMPVSNSNSPSIVYSSSNEGDVSITVTASNSSGTDTKSQNYTYYVGKKPEFTISPESEKGYRGVDVTYKASATYGTDFIWSWAIDGTVKQTSDSDEFTYNWKSDDYGYHVITVKATSEYGTTTKNYSYQVVPETGVTPEITNIEGSQNLDVDSQAKYKAIFVCSDDYNISWYLNGELKQQMTNVQSGNNVYTVHDLSPGSYTIKVILTTEYEETAEFSKNISVVESLEPTTADSIVPAGSDMQNIALNDSNSGSTALKNVDTVEIDSGDLSGESGDVVIEANVVSQDDLKGFTPEMGNKEDALISIELTPTGLKNEKKLESGAEIKFRLLKSSIGDPDQIGFFRLDTKDEIEKWVKLTVISYEEEGEYIIFTVRTSGFSTFVSTSVAVTQDTPEPTPVTGSSSSVTAFDGVKSGDNFTFENAVVITKATLPGASSAKVINTSGSGWYNFTLTADGFKGNGTLYFQVPLDVISVKGWNASDVSLLGCKTTYLTSEGGYAKYSAIITKDGSYTIDFEKGASEKAVTETKPVTETPKTQEPTKIAETPVTTETVPAKTPIPVLGILAGLGIAGVLVMRRR